MANPAMKKSVTIAIPAYNEEKSILLLLSDLTKQKEDKHFKLSKIIVYSDGSTDNTNQLIKNFKIKKIKFRFVLGKKRTGKSEVLNKLFKLINTDILVLFDADVRIFNNLTVKDLIKPILKDNQIILTAGDVLPIKKAGLNFAEKSSMFSNILLKNLKKLNFSNAYFFHGRIMALSRNFYKELKIPKVPGTDQFIFLRCLKKKYGYHYVPSARVWYHLPTSIKDYLKQSLRFEKSKSANMNRFNNKKIKDYYSIMKKDKIFINSFRECPNCAICWGVLYLMVKVILFFQKESLDGGHKWEISNSTK